MPYIGNTPADKFLTLAKQNFSTSATTSYTLDSAVSSTQDIALFINNVRQSPVDAYSVSGTALTLTSATAGTDEMYCVYLGKTVGTVNPPNDSVGLDQLSATGTPSSSNYLRGDNSWQTISAGTSLSGSTDNTVTTVTGANAIQGETNFIYNGTIVGAGADGANADLGVGLHIKTSDTGASVNNDGDDLVIENGGSGLMTGMTFLSATNGYGGISFGDSGSNTIGQMYYYHTNNSMHFKTNSVERLRLAGDGEVSINDSFADTNANGQFKVKGSLDETTCKIYHGSTSGSQNLFVFYDKDVENCGGISINASANTVAYNTSSDYRLKENETALTDGITRLKQLKPYRFNWKADSGGDKVDGFFAHEVSSIVPEAIHGSKDAMTTDDDGKEIINPQQIDQSKLVPLLTGALQEALTKIETLETKVTALENK